MKSAMLLLLILGLLTLGCTGATPRTANATGAQNVSDKCLSMPASEVDNYNLKDVDMNCYGDKYVLAAYLGNTNYTDCDKIILELYRGACYGAYGGFLNDSSRCSEFSDTTTRNMCIFTFAINVGDLAACNQITSEALKEECIKNID